MKIGRVFICWIWWKIKLSWGNCERRFSKWKTEKCQLIKKDTKSLKNQRIFCVNGISLIVFFFACVINLQLLTQISSFVVSFWSLYKSTISGDLWKNDIDNEQLSVTSFLYGKIRYCSMSMILNITCKKELYIF